MANLDLPDKVELQAGIRGKCKESSIGETFFFYKKEKELDFFEDLCN